MSNLARGLGSWMVLLLLVSCAADTATSDGAGGRGADAEPQRGSSATLAASLRRKALRAMQKAPGHDFTAEGEVLPSTTSGTR